MWQSKQMSLPSLFYNFGCRNIIFFGILGESVKCKVGKNAILVLSRAEISGGSRPGHKVSGTRSKFPNLNENGQKSHFLQGFSDSEPGQHFV